MVVGENGGPGAPAPGPVAQEPGSGGGPATAQLLSMVEVTVKDQTRMSRTAQPYPDLVWAILPMIPSFHIAHNPHTLCHLAKANVLQVQVSFCTCKMNYISEARILF